MDAVINPEQIKRIENLHIAFGNLPLEEKIKANNRVDQFTNDMTRLVARNILPRDIINMVSRNFGQQSDDLKPIFQKLLLILQESINNKDHLISVMIQFSLMSYAFALELETIEINQLAEGIE